MAPPIGAGGVSAAGGAPGRALDALIATFTPEQRRLYMAYEPRCNAASSAELEYLFHKAFSLGLYLARL